MAWCLGFGDDEEFTVFIEALAFNAGFDAKVFKAAPDKAFADVFHVPYGVVDHVKLVRGIWA